MKKIFSVAVALLMAASVTACSNTSTANPTEGSANEAAKSEEGSGTSAQASGDAEKSGYPEKTIQITIPFNAGSNTDTQMRFIQKYLEKALGVSTAIVNNGGASGVIGTTDFINQKADGYTVLFSLPTPTVYKPTTGETEYKTEDLIPVARVSGAPMYLVVKADSEFTTGTDLVEYIKNNPDTFTYANAGNGGIAQLAFASFLHGEGLSATSVPFNGGTADCYTAVMGGHVASYVAGEQDLTGREDVRPLINLGTKSENGRFADVPTLEEMGYSGYVIDNFSGFYFSKDVDPEIVKAFDEAVSKMMSDPEFVEAAKEQGFAASYAGSEEFTEQIQNTVTKITPVLESLGMKK